MPTPGLLTHMWFPTRNPNMEDFIAKDQQFVADWIVRLGLDKLVEVFSILCISSLLIKAQLSLYIARSGTINVNRRTHASLNKDLSKIWLRCRFLNYYDRLLNSKHVYRDRRFILSHIIKIFTTDFYNVKIFVY